MMNQALHKEDRAQDKLDTTSISWKEKREVAERDQMEMQQRLAAAFGSAVTIASSKSSDWVARKGDESLYSAFREMLPQVISKFE